MTGIVFDIQRFSIHDGPGIRTTVFLKGCPLRCIWCHNPESMLARPQLMYRKEQCRNCLCCVGSCQVHRQEQGRHVVDLDKCHGTGVCAAHCKYGALKLSGVTMSTDEIMKEVCADQTYYKNSGGGLTVSGGEPMLQFDFLLELLQKAKEKGVHTCIETSGYAETEKFQKLRNLVDMFLFDIKHTGDTEHKKYTGVSNQLILQNLEMLYDNNASIVLRCPMIPGINDTGEHIKGISALSQRYPNLRGIELMPYHDMGKGKWEQIGREYSLSELQNMTEDRKIQLLQKFREYGCDKVTY